MLIFPLYYFILLWSVNARAMMNNLFLFEKWAQILWKYSRPLSLWNIWIFAWNCVSTMLKNILKQQSSSCLSFNKYTQHKRAWSSTIVMNHLFLELVGIFVCPHTSLWIRLNSLDPFYGRLGKYARWCFANWHTSHSTDTFLLKRNSEINVANFEN